MMKKLIILPLLIALMLSVSSCSDKPAPEPPEVEGVLYITDYGKDYGSAASRAQKVITAFTQQVAIFVERNNGTIELSDPEKYFLDKSYILTTFVPFQSDCFAFTRAFVKDAAPEQVEQEAVSLGIGENVFYEKTGKTDYRLTVEDSDSFDITCEYSKKYDSLRYVRTDYDNADDTSSVTDFIEFAYVEDYGYFISSETERCHIIFDDQGNITEFSYSRLSQGGYDCENDGFYPETTDLPEQFDSGWVAGSDKSAYICIYTYDGDTFTYNDCSSGEWQTVEVK